jgi:hypothetical protein
MGGRLETTLEAVPDARFVHVLRHPYEAIPSLLSMFTMPWWTHSPHLRRDGPEVRALAQMTVDYYRRMDRLEAELGSDRVITVRYEDLIADPEETVRQVYDRFEMVMGPELEARLRGELSGARAYRSGHQYSLEAFGLNRDWVYQQMPEVFAAHGFAR